METQFAKKEAVTLTPEMTEGIMVPPIYVWLSDFVDGEPKLMTAAVLWKGLRFGLSFPVDDNKVQARMDSVKLMRHMREISSVLALHGEKVLDGDQQISMEKLNEQEAIRFKHDPLWEKRTKAVDQLIKVKDISEQEARELKML